MRGQESRRTLVTRFRGSASAKEVDAVPDYVDLRVHDLVALEEIDLYADVLGAVAASDRPLTARELDEVLGLLPISHLCGSAATICPA
jgi:hypothetical protein